MEILTFYVYQMFQLLLLVYEEQTIIFAVLLCPSFEKGSHCILYFSISFERFYSCSKCEKILHKQLHTHTTGRLFYKF